MDSIVTVIIIILSIVVAILLGYFFLSSNSSSNESSKQKTSQTKSASNPSKQQPKPKKEYSSEVGLAKKKLKEEEDALKVGTFKGFTEDLTCARFTPNGKFIIGTSKDRTLRILKTSELTTPGHRVVRINLPFDHATSFCITSDSHHILLTMSSGDILAYQFFSKPGEDGKSYKEVYKFSSGHKLPIQSIDVSTNSKFIITNTEDPELILWTLKGQKKETIHTSQIKYNNSKFSPDCRYFGISTWTSDLKLWELIYNKTGELDKLKEAMILKGHKNSIHDFDFFADSTKVVTASKDGTWKLWKIHGRYEGSDPETILTIESPDSSPFDKIKISPDSKTVAVTQESALHFYSIEGKLLQTVSQAHNSSIISLDFSSDSQFLLTGGDNLIKIWKIPNYQ